MERIDPYSYACGVIDCFNEMVKAGLKKIALSHPADSATERDLLLPFSQEICKKYGNGYYVEDDPLLTDLFPISMNRGKFNIIFWRNREDIDEYLKIKEDKRQLVDTGAYSGDARRQIAIRYGKLLSYPEEGILRLISENTEKE